MRISRVLFVLFSSTCVLGGCSSTSASSIPRSVDRASTAPPSRTEPARYPGQSPRSTPRRAVRGIPSDGEPAALRSGPSIDTPSAPSAASQSVDEPESVASQIARLEHAIALYQQFIDRADDDPRMQEAVARSRDRIEDAKATIIFLQGGPN